MRRKYMVELIDRVYSSTNDSESFADSPPREVLADRKSIRQSEFYQAVANGFNPQATFIIWDYEYSDEEFLRYDGKLYQIIRRYPDKDDKQIELVCQLASDINRDLTSLRDGF